MIGSTLLKHIKWIISCTLVKLALEFWPYWMKLCRIHSSQNYLILGKQGYFILGNKLEYYLYISSYILVSKETDFMKWNLKRPGRGLEYPWGRQSSSPPSVYGPTVTSLNLASQISYQPWIHAVALDELPCLCPLFFMAIKTLTAFAQLFLCWDTERESLKTFYKSTVNHKLHIII